MLLLMKGVMIMAYNKINWENGSVFKEGYVLIDGVKHNTVQPEYSGETPINADNLNHMDEGIYQNDLRSAGVVLYDGVGVTNTTLSQSIAPFKRIVIQTIANNNITSVLQALKDTTTSEILVSALTGSTVSNAYYGANARININGTSLTVDRVAEFTLRSSGVTITTTTDSIKVNKVIGYYNY